MNAVEEAGFDDVLEWADYVVGLTKRVCRDCGDERCGWHIAEIQESWPKLVSELVSEVQRLRSIRCTCRYEWTRVEELGSYWELVEPDQKCPVHGEVGS